MYWPYSLNQKKMWSAVLLVFSSLVCSGIPYRILGLIAYNGKSHFVMQESIMKGLAERGHRMDVVSHFPLKKPIPNYNQVINLAGTLPDVMNNVTYDFIKTSFPRKVLPAVVATQFGTNLCHLMDHPELRELIQNPPRDPPYDVIIVELLGADCYLALGKHFNVPVIGTVTSPMWPWANDRVANPDNPAIIPSVFSGLGERMSFWERLENTVHLMKEKFEFEYHSAEQNELTKKYIGPHAPSLWEARNNVSLILVNTHFSLNGVRPFTSAVVEVGGLHAWSTAEPLPKDLEQWLNDSKDGFVYVSFGSMAKTESFPQKMLDVLFASLAKLSPIRALMKISVPDEALAGLPKNVLTRAWLPQLAVLQHKNVRAFLTHGGLMGGQEAVYCGVPMIGVPLFSDQFQNVERYVRRNLAVPLHHDQLTEETLDAALDAVLHDPSYMKAAKKMSSEFRDRPMSPVDTAVFWVEYVARHGGTNLRSPALDLTWWQIALLDVFGALLFALVLIVYVLRLVIKRLIVVVRQANVANSKKIR